jgi:hypothetical protein
MIAEARASASAFRKARRLLLGHGNFDIIAVLRPREAGEATSSRSSSPTNSTRRLQSSAPRSGQATNSCSRSSGTIEGTCTLHVTRGG